MHEMIRRTTSVAFLGKDATRDQFVEQEPSVGRDGASALMLLQQAEDDDPHAPDDAVRVRIDVISHAAPSSDFWSATCQAMPSVSSSAVHPRCTRILGTITSMS